MLSLVPLLTKLTLGKDEPTLLCGGPKCVLSPEPEYKLTITGQVDQTTVDCSSIKGKIKKNVLSIELIGITSIAANSFTGFINVKNVILPSQPDTPFTMGNSAFENCFELNEINLPTKNFVTIPDLAFKFCKKLSSITIPECVTKIGANAFQSCEGLINVVLSENVQEITIGEGAFQNCILLNQFTIPKNLKAISSLTFKSCQELTSISIPIAVSSIGNEAFSSCAKLAKVVFPAVETFSIGNSAFAYCKELKEITLPAVATIGTNLFEQCLLLESVVLPTNAFTTIPQYTFKGCQSLTSMTIPDSVTTIDIGAFDGCTSLTKVVFPTPVSEFTIAANAFANCIELVEISLPTVFYTQIAPSTFKNCQKLNNLVIPNTVTVIGTGAFENCYALSSIQLPDNEDYIEIAHSTFKNCKALSQITLPKNIHTIGEMAFYQCEKLTTITYEKGQITAIKGDSFAYCLELSSFSLPEDAQYVKIEAGTFMGCSKLSKITIPAQIQTIGYKSFCECSLLETVTFVEGTQLSTIEGESFSKCTQLKNDEKGLLFPTTVLTIGASAFDSCESLVKVSSLNENAQIESGAFAGCINLESIDLPTNLVIINSLLFKGCTKLQSIVIPQTVGEIGKSAFNGCTELTSLDLPNRISKIGKEAFCNCIKLESINFKGTFNPSKNDITSGSKSTLQIIVGFEYTDSLFGNANVIKIGKITEDDVDIKYITKYNELIFTGKEGHKSLTTNTILSSIKGSVTKLTFNEITTIGASFFDGFIGLVELNIPETITTIGANAFNGCTSLNVVSVLSGENIAANAFSNCANIYTVNILGKDIVKGPSLSALFPQALGKIASVKIASTITGFANTPFTGLTALKSIYYLGTNSFNEVTLGADSSKTNAYVTSQYPSQDNFGKEIIPKTIINAYGELIWRVQEEVDQTKTLVIAGTGIMMDSETESPFKTTESENIKKIDISEGITSIGNNCFKGFTNLAIIDIPTSINKIGSNAFEGCNTLETFTIKSSVTTLGENIFEKCDGLQKIIYQGTKSYPELVLASSLPEQLQIIVSFDYQDNLFGTLNVIKETQIAEGKIKVEFNTKSLEAKITGSGAIPEGTPFVGIKSATKLVIGEGITTICAKCFSFYTFLQEIIISSTVKDIGESAFAYCTKVTKIIFIQSEDQAQITTIGAKAFQGLYDLTEFVIPSTLKLLANSFDKCTKLVSISIPLSDNIEENAFTSCPALETVNILGSGDIQGLSLSLIFPQSKSIKTVNIADTITGFANPPFTALNQLKSIYYFGSSNFNDFDFGVAAESTVSAFVDFEKYPTDAKFGKQGINKIELHHYGTLFWIFIDDETKTLKITGNGIMNDAVDKSPFTVEGLLNVYIEDGVTTIGANCFKGLATLKTVQIPTSVIEIGANAFNGCESIVSLIIPNSVKTLGENAFEGCILLNSIKYYGTNNPGDVALASTSIPKDLEIVVNLNYEDLTFGKTNVVKVGYLRNVLAKFDTKAQEIDLSGKGKLPTAGETPFLHCDVVKKVTVGEKITEIGSYAFKGFSTLESITFANTVLTIENNVFEGCIELKEITLPASLTQIGENIFDGCENLATIKYQGTADLSKSDLGNLAKQSEMEIIVSMDYEYETFGTIAVTQRFESSESGLITISCPAKNVKEITISGSGELTEEIKKLIAKFPGFTKLSIENGISSIAQSLFANILTLNEVSISASVKDIGASAFENCEKLVTITFVPEQLERKLLGNEEGSIGDSAFKGCKSLTKIEIPSTYSSIGTGSFESCTSLQSVVIPKEAKAVKKDAFKGCSNLNSVSVPSNAGVEAGAFSECDKIETVNILGSGKVEGKPLSDIFPAAQKSIKSVKIDPEVSSFTNVPFQGLDQLEEVHYYGTNDFSDQKLGAPSTAKAVVSEEYKGEQFGSDSKLEKVPTKQYGELVYKFDEATKTLEILGIGQMEDSETQKSPFENIDFVVLKISEGITSIGSFCFKGIKSLNFVTIPASVTEIHNKAFSESGLIEITYNGKTDFSLLPADTIPAEVKIFVKEDYPSDKFAGQNVIKRDENEKDENPPDENDSKEGGGISPGGIAGIVIAVIVVVAAICIAVYFFVIKKSTDKTQDSKNNTSTDAAELVEF